ncbi:MAG: DUF1450 domain-containing protein [Acidibacillus sp.]|nr:DUF1450 domain-containing protein [Acidibacillus sp.]
MIIEVCASNEMSTWIPKLEAHNIEVITYSCLDRCESCLFHAYAYANGKLVEDADAEIVYAELLHIQADEDQLFIDEDW